MSSILGIFYKHKPIRPELAKKIAHQIDYWQADRLDTWTGHSCALGCLQLYNTPEAASEKQPLTRAHLKVVADCRLDNRSTLCNKLNLETKTPDTTLIAAAYLKWGDACTKHLIGDFSFIIWNQKTQSLFCARDHIGVRPLFYFNNAHLFAVATEMKTLLAIPEIKPKLSESHIARTLSFEAVMACDYTENTFYQGIYRLTPAHQCRVSEKGLVKSQYWDLDPYHENHLTNESDYIEQYQSLLSQAVKDRTRHYQGIASELSGGIDSSAVTAHASKFEQNLQAITHVSQNDTLYTDETAQAIKLCKHNHIQSHHLIDASDYDLEKAISHCVKTVDQPLPVTNPILAHDVHQKVNALGCDVLLSGFGGDECVTDHANLQKQELADQKKWRTLWHELKQQAKIDQKKALRPFVRYYLSKRHPLIAQFLQKSKTNQTVPLNALTINAEFAKTHNLPVQLENTLSRYNFDTVRQREYACVVGKESWHLRARIENSNLCALGLRFEYRYPLLDIRLLQFCLSAPSWVKRKDGWGRYLARRSLTGLLPSELQWRNDKAGSPVPAALYVTKEQGLLEKTLLKTPFSKEITAYFGEIDTAKFNQADDLKALYAYRAGLQALSLQTLLNQRHMLAQID